MPVLSVMNVPDVTKVNCPFFFLEGNKMLISFPTGFLKEAPQRDAQQSTGTDHSEATTRR